MLKATEINTLKNGFGITRGLRLTIETNKHSCKSMSWKMTIFKKKIVQYPLYLDNNFGILVNTIKQIN
jgi:hypothetical protein